MSERVKIFDTTLRDGEQSPGVGLRPEEKLEIALQLARLGVDIIEAGFPISSPGDFQGVKAIADQVEGPTIAALARTNKADIEATWNAIKGAKKPRIHTFIATSPVHMTHKLRMTPEQVLAATAEACAYASGFGCEVEFSCEDATRSDWNFLAQVFTVATQNGATVLNVPDTVGYTTPQEYHDLIKFLKENVKAPRPVEFSVHCHNDLGLAVANSLAAVEAGARQIECTINGVGERAGNAALEEIVMALRTRADRFGIGTNINTQEIYRSSRLISQRTGMPVQPNKAIVGANAFSHQSGIHQDGVLKERTTYEIMRPQDIGVNDTAIVLGKNSGRAGFRDRLSRLGLKIEGEDFQRAFQRFKELADRKAQITDADLEAIVGDERRSAAAPEIIRLESFQVVTGTNAVPTATIRLTREGGRIRQEAASGDGAVDALYRALDRAADFKGKLIDYQIRAVTGGQDALGEVMVKVEAGGRTAVARGVSTDVLEASVRAYVAAMNKLLSEHESSVQPDEAVGWMQRVWS